MEVIAFLLPCLLMRTVLVFQFSEAQTLYSILGFLSDISTILLLYVLVSSWKLFSYAPKILLLLILSLAHLAHYEFLHAIGSPLNIMLMSDFLFDSVAWKGSIREELLSEKTVLFLLFTFIFYFLVLKYSRGFKLPSTKKLAIIAIIAALPSITSSSSVYRSPWVTLNVLAYNLKNLLGGSFGDELYSIKDQAVAQQEWVPKQIGLQQKNFPNILLLILEGVGGKSFDLLSKPMKAEKGFHLKKTEEWLEKRGRFFNNFLANASQTNRGTYALFCGDPPNITLNDSKMTYYARQTKQIPLCLPKLLGTIGYQSAYIQSSNLAFMHKDEFFPKIGFDQVLGENVFVDYYSKNGWGVDDKSLFHQLLNKMSQLNGAQKPWFIGALTAGTHHPYNIPVKYRNGKEQSMFLAIQYLDDSLLWMLEEMKTKNFFENTLVVITSDEAHGRRGLKGINRTISQNRLPLIVFGPKIASGLDERPGLQSDLATTIMDYVGQVSPLGGVNLLGREENRTRIYGRQAANIVSYELEDGSLISCDSQIQHCEFHQGPRAGALFSGEPKVGVPPKEQVHRLKSLLGQSQIKEQVQSKSEVIRIAAIKSMDLAVPERAYKLVGEQRLSVTAGNVLNGEIGLEIGGRIELALSARSHSDRKTIAQFENKIVMRSGRVVLNFRIPVEKSSSNLEIQVYAKTRIPQKVKVYRAHMRLEAAKEIEKPVVTYFKIHNSLVQTLKFLRLS